MDVADRRGPGRVRRPRRAARRPRRPARRPRGPGGRQADRARRAQGAARRAHPRAPTTPTGRRCSRSFLSGGTFTDLLAEMSYSSTSASRTRRSPSRSPRDQETLAALHQTVAGHADRTNDLRQETAAQKRDARREPARAQGGQGRARASSRRRRHATSRCRRRRYAKLAAQQGERRARRSPRPRPTQKQLAGQIAELIRQAGRQQGNIPSRVQRHAALADGRAT